MYIRRITLSLLCDSFTNQDFEDEFEDLLGLLNKSAESLEIVVNLVKDEEINSILLSIDSSVENILLEKSENNDSIFSSVITQEIANSFLYRLAKLA